MTVVHPESRVWASRGALSGDENVRGDLPVPALQVADLGIRSPTLASASASGDEPFSCSAISLILGPGVDSRAIASSSLQVTSCWRHSRDDNP